MKHQRVIPHQLFVLPKELLANVTNEEVNATWRDMKEMALDKPPVPYFDLLMGYNITRETVNELKDEESATALALIATHRFFVSETGDIKYDCLIKGFSYMHDTKFNGTPMPTNPNDTAHMARIGHTFYKLLLVMLATKNTDKRVEVNKLAARGIGVGKGKYATTTYISMGRVTESSEGSNGSVRRPHLRRGHIRHQRYGKGLSFVKRIWIDPMFIHVDAGWLAERTSYQLTK